MRTTNTRNLMIVSVYYISEDGLLEYCAGDVFGCSREDLIRSMRQRFVGNDYFIHWGTLRQG